MSQQPHQLRGHQREHDGVLAPGRQALAKREQFSGGFHQPRRQWLMPRAPAAGAPPGHQTTHMGQRQWIEQQGGRRVKTDPRQPMGGGCGRTVQMQRRLGAATAAATAATTAHHHPRPRRQLIDRGRFRLGRQGHPLPRRQPLLQPLELAHAAAAQTCSGSVENKGPDGVQPGAKPGAAGVGPLS